jgi:single-strand DNA-binding protein
MSPIFPMGTAPFPEEFNRPTKSIKNIMNINRVLLNGNLTADPEIAEAGRSRVVHATLASHQSYENTNEERQEVTTFVDIKIWGPSADNFAKFARRGREFFVEGSLRQDRWEDEQGKKRSKLYVHVLSWQFAQRKNDDPPSQPPANGTAKNKF